MTACELLTNFAKKLHCIVDVRVCSKYVFSMQWKLVDWFLFDANFYRKVFINRLLKSGF